MMTLLTRPWLCVAGEMQAEFAPIEDNPELPRVLLIGDSISVGYTLPVREMLAGEANVHRACENCGATSRGVERVDACIADGPWDVIHFNFGLHDLKREDPETHAASRNPAHPRQAELEVYERQLRQIVERLKSTGAALIFATTTPVPSGDLNPLRDVEDPARYNAAALRVMEENDVAINDLYTFALERLDKIQLPANVHFTPEGSRLLGEQVAHHIRQALKEHESSRGDEPQK